MNNTPETESRTPEKHPPFCPQLSSGAMYVPCQREHCAWWIEAQNPEYSRCAMVDCAWRLARVTYCLRE